MKMFINILVCFIFVTNCKAQDSVFQKYLSGFGNSRMPLLVEDNQSFSEVFFQAYDTLLQTKTFKHIPENMIKKFISASGYFNSNGDYFEYYYGVKVDFSDDFIAVLVLKSQFESDSKWDFDLMEALLIVYNNKGEILSKQSITKDNDWWKSSLKISKDDITVRQIKIIEPDLNQDLLKCELWSVTYKIAKTGEIKTINTSSVSPGILVWDKSKADFILKEGQ